ncbi:regulator of nonsense transcripts 2 isoform X2 [Nannospalax galili]|uniref:regulator of nonsense transcripts 2 isoform X2 n=1 Tax=Nannospalax galili TaxID=1026970 RepID=UPI000819D97E|nr:regulator of nonsense transcripts 2 isoform X2 [Nannospalax galili]
MDFCMNMNTKANRKKLVRALFIVPRQRLDLLPFYARLVATLHPCMSDVAEELCSMLRGDFRFHVRKKDQINIETKNKTVRFIGELTKFKMFTKNDTLHCLKMLLSDFSHHHIEMACTLLETCGRFLFRSPESHLRTSVLLEQMMRKKQAMHLDAWCVTMVENAYYYCNPPPAEKTVKKRVLLSKNMSGNFCTRTSLRLPLRRTGALPRGCWDPCCGWSFRRYSIGNGG